MLLSKMIYEKECMSNYFALALFEQDIADAGPVELYFDNPFDLIHVFRAMETQNLNALIHLESLAAPMAEMITTITATEEGMKREIREISSTIDDLEVRIGFIHKINSLNCTKECYIGIRTIGLTKQNII